MSSSDAVSVDRDEGHRHILIVEDEASTAEMLSAYFVSLDYEVSHTGWGRDAVEMAAAIQPDLVILDIHLPDIDGYEVCLQLRAHTRTAMTPVIFLTERRERVNRLTGLELGAVDYITKPFDVQELRFRVRNSLRRTTRETLLHPVTGLPTSDLVAEELRRVAEDPGMVIMGVTIKGMAAFSEAYGFVTHDDVLRAVALILRNTTPDSGSRDFFVGQIDPYQYVLVTPAGQMADLVKDQLYQRLSEAASFFYPHLDWERGTRSDGSDIPRLEFDIALLPLTSVSQPDALKTLRGLLGSDD